jgi:hypothetical protein
LCNACFCVCFAKLNKIIYWYRQYVGDMQVYIGVYKSEIEFLRKTRAELLREITELRNEKIQDNDE